jgi:hypothetical protein
MNLELIRAGYPSIIIRRKDRERYLDALGDADEGDLAPFLDIVVGRTEDALRDLERAATRFQGYDQIRQRYIHQQANRLDIWNAGVNLLATTVRALLEEQIGDEGTVVIRTYDELTVEDFIELCENRPVRLSWAFVVKCQLPGRPIVERLAWAGVLGPELRRRLQEEPGRPVICWSRPNPDGVPKWRVLNDDAPGGKQMTIYKDRWLVTKPGGLIQEYTPGDLAQIIANSIISQTIPDGQL